MIAPGDKKSPATNLNQDQPIPSYAEALAGSTSSHTNPANLEAQPPVPQPAAAQPAAPAATPNAAPVIVLVSEDRTATQRARRRFLAAFFYAGLYWILITMLTAGVTEAAMYDPEGDWIVGKWMAKLFTRPS